MLDILKLKLKTSRSTSVFLDYLLSSDLRLHLSFIGLEKVLIDTNYRLSIDTTFNPSMQLLNYRSTFFLVIFTVRINDHASACALISSNLAVPRRPLPSIE
ncbi:hypothetical protein IGI04_020034 [Brassica rapa subsp. trilocularis]|uniref:Uncharacterized protein n=1 Tax=Brassica rapa subsp. trilocularis TaxID=1813537 RepID=A0ABQ7MHK7_BRACM|nr:hypothetical protein IGI04_020034 [Brassica rapa subsp. trilocularis]